MGAIMVTWCLNEFRLKRVLRVFAENATVACYHANRSH